MSVPFDLVTVMFDHTTVMFDRADYEEDTGAHILTYQFGTQKEEKERVALALKRPDELQVGCWGPGLGFRLLADLGCRGFRG